VKKILLVAFIIFTAYCVKAQAVKEIFVNLYTDSLKKGTHNYINIDGKLDNGRFVPLDNSKVNFECKQAKFEGNNLVLPSDFGDSSVLIKVSLKQNANIFKEFSVAVKRMDDPPLKTASEILQGMKTQQPEKKKKKKK
jgi:hypothetical protein